MKLIKGNNQVPVIYTAHHASHDFGEFDDRVALTQEQKIRFSDYGTDLTVPVNGLATIISEKSRALGDLNHEPGDAAGFQLYDYNQPNRNEIWKKGLELTLGEMEYCTEKFYEPFHEAITDQLRNRSELTYVVAWDNTAHYLIGDRDSNERVMMRPFILSNRGTEGDAQAAPNETVSCDPEFLTSLAKLFSSKLQSYGLPSEVLCDYVYKGGYICRLYNTRRNKSFLEKKGVKCEVQSLQLEYDASITHDPISLAPNLTNINSIKQAFTEAIIEATSECYI